MLVSTGSPFKISVNLSFGFNYFMTNLEPGNTSSRKLTKKKSPSTIRRNVARRDEFIRKKKEAASSNGTNLETVDMDSSQLANPLSCV